ncbi:unnamed protein product [Rhizoctonia solani]|uniref:Transcription factor domain-containing protein n=1 Tax=Rhizoctonia solani TaxID=456999 RepID=A0A8H3D6X7_9AGAM|nr:unnamed protein product [Rhizoctonia solani]
MLRQKVKTLEAMIGTKPSDSSLSVSVPAKRRSPSGDSPPRPHPPPQPSKRSVTLSSEDQVKLLNQFIKVQHVAYEYTDIPPNHIPPNPHPAGEPYAAKTSAFLLASHFSSNPHHRSLATDLLECARECIDEAIHTADISSQSMTLARPMPSPALVLDAIHASSLLASWLLVQGRCVECQQTLFSAAKLVSRYMRRLPPSVSGNVTSALLKEDFLTYWVNVPISFSVHLFEGAVNVSLPWEDCPSEVRVETIWPDFDSNGTTCTSIASLFQTGRKASPAPTLGSTGSIRAGSPSSAMDPHALRAKSIVLLERAVRLSAQRERGSRASTPRSPHSPGQASPTRTTVGDPIRAAIKETDAAISNVLEQLPTSRSISCLHPHTLLLCARVRLHETLASQDHVSQVVWVQSAVAIVRLLDGMHMDDIVRGADLLLAYAWMASYMVLLHERYYVPYHPESEHAARIKSDLDRLQVLLDTVGTRMPVIATLFKTSVDQFHSVCGRKSTSPFATPPPPEKGDFKMEDQRDEPAEDDSSNGRPW